jgi:hypothetical protein
MTADARSSPWGLVVIIVLILGLGAAMWMQSRAMDARLDEIKAGMSAVMSNVGTMGAGCAKAAGAAAEAAKPPAAVPAP